MDFRNHSTYEKWPEYAIEEVMLLQMMGLNFSHAKNEVAKKYNLDMNYFISCQTGQMREELEAELGHEP